MLRCPVLLPILALLVLGPVPPSLRAATKAPVSAEEALKRSKAAFAKEKFWSPEALRWCQIAAEKGSLEAEYALAQYYSSAESQKLLDNDAAAYGEYKKLYKRWLDAAADGGYGEAVKERKQLAAKDKRWAGKAKTAPKRKAPPGMEAVFKKAEAGDAQAQSEMGDFYANTNDKGTPAQRDDQEAIRWYEKAALQGDSASEYVLGDFFYLEGRGVPQDLELAQYWLRKAAEQGNAQAEMALGQLYEEGKGVEKDWAQARLWYQRAVDHHWPMAQYGLQRVAAADGGDGAQADEETGPDADALELRKGDAYADPNGGRFDPDLARQWYGGPAQRGNAEAQLKLADLFDGECGGFSDPADDDKNCRQALQWYRQAAGQGNAKAAEQVKRYQEAGW
jgi:TPR repeat protein